jgi:predicted CXXCH cytochrome family protein
MERKKTPNQNFLKILFTSLLVGLLSMGIVVGIAQAQDGGTPTPEPGAEMTAAPTGEIKPCKECHPDVQDAWSASSHAHALDNQEFTARWDSLGNPGECLVCHSTGYQANTGQYAAAGVTCQACHGETREGHPPAVMPVRGDTEYCGTCHTTTLGEWRLTGHAAAQVGCKDCHNPHSQKALFENPDEMCINCHKDDIGEHKDDLHIQKGITCVECHTLVLPPETQPVDGLAPTGHSFRITPATCVACHTDTLRIGKPLPGYEDGAMSVSASMPVSATLPTLVAEYTGETSPAGELSHDQQIQALEAALASSRLSTLFQGGIVGLVLGGATAFYLALNLKRRAEFADEAHIEHEQAPDEDSGNEKA